MTPTTIESTSLTLAHVLDEELVFSPSFRKIYSSHLAMMLVALEQMGATPDRLTEVLERHAAGGAELRDDVELLDERRAEVARDGIEATVRRRLPDVVDAPGTALFHPAIRLAYALDAEHPGQVAAALLDWERRRHVLPLPVLRAGGRRLPEVASLLAAEPAGTWSRTFDLDGIARRPEVAAALQGVALDDRTLDDVSTFALAAHATADDFVTLHLVTGARAIRRIAQVVDVEVAERLAAASFETVAVAYAAIGAPPLLPREGLDDLRRAALPTRGEIEARAIVDDDPHVVKLANVALVEEARTGDPLYRYLAARVLGLTPVRS